MEQVTLLRGEPTVLSAGYGDGSVYGSGYGDGSGAGYGSEDYWRACVACFAAKWPQAQQDRLQELRNSGALIAYWRSDEEGRAANGGCNEPVIPGTVEEVAGPLVICTRGFHATVMPPKWKGARWWVVALIGEVQQEADKYAALKREIVGECL